MTETELRQLARYMHDLNQKPIPPKPSSIGAGTFLLGFLMVCLTVVYFPELRFHATLGDRWMIEQLEWIRQWLAS